MRPEELIPRPGQIRAGEGVLTLDGGVRIAGDAGCRMAADYLRARLGGRVSEAGRPLLLNRVRAAGSAEGYRLSISSDGVRIEGEPAGLLRGAVTLCQLLTDGRGGIGTAAPCCQAEDAPAFEWRGLMLDCSRHFLSLDYLKRSVEMLVELKMNVLHLHLVDDHGWRVEIDAYPELTAAGSRVESGERREGFYTKADLRELVGFAAARGVEVVPEIEVPGHSYAAVRSYPILCCTREPVRNEGHQKDLYCAGRESTFEFLEAVLGEVLEIFPSKYVHLGGDEAPKDRWRECPDCQERIRAEGLAGEEELQSYVFRRVADFLEARGRKAIGWEEILDGDPSAGTVVHWWRSRTHGDDALRRALKRGHRVLCSPNSLCYLSFPVNPDGNFKPERTSDLETVYSAEYAPTDLDVEKRGLILGAECCIWTEYLVEEEIGSMLFPRVLACAELMWSHPSDRDFEEFRGRVRLAEEFWREQGITYGPEKRS
ncbi:MAG: beta-N-acetylhexosaminidase [Planctomycetota bacterium]|jgi:hexosaminidase